MDTHHATVAGRENAEQQILLLSAILKMPALNLTPVKWLNTFQLSLIKTLLKETNFKK
jgi:hypothetical protein